MAYHNPQIAETAALLSQRISSLSNKTDILKAEELKALFAQIPTLPKEERAEFGKELNTLRQELQALVEASQSSSQDVRPAIDVTAPFDANVSENKRPVLLPTQKGSKHPLMTELEKVLDIFYRMGFTAVESPELDDDYHMFGSLNFPEGHPARDSFDTFMTNQLDAKGKQYIAPAHTSTMQNRVLRAHKAKLESGEPIAVVIPGRTFRNEDIDARHEHTFYQFEGVYVGQGIHAGNLLATFKTFLSEYYQQDIDIRSQPFYFPFTEPSFELALSCPFCKKMGCHVCGQAGWIELLGMGMVHPNVLKEAGIDPTKYTGFAWGCGLDRLVMMKYDIEDIRHFESGKLDFLRQFA
jgi:phenylalanyl-tRNA synthetase alpha chain